MRHASLILAATLVALAACDDRVVDPSILWIESNYSGTCTLVRSIHHTPGADIVDDRIEASFQDHAGGGLYAGEVSVDGRPLRIDTTATESPSSRSLTYRATSKRDTVAIPFGGAQIVVAATGSDRIPAFHDSLVSPESALAVVSPSPKHLVSKARGLTVAWSTTSDRRTIVSIRLVVADTVDGAERIRTKLRIEDLADNGERVLTPEDLERVAPGDYRLIVARSVSRPIAIAGNKRVLLGAGSEAWVDVTIAE
jgi:hypothetical protein